MKNQQRKLVKMHHRIKNAQAILLSGFKSQLTGFTIVFEDKNKQQFRYLIGNTALGYYNDNINQFEKVWFEYDTSDEELTFTITLF